MPKATRKVATTRKDKLTDGKGCWNIHGVIVAHEQTEASVGLMPPVHQVPTTPQFVVELNGKISDAFAELFANEEPAMIDNNGKKKYTKAYFLRQHMKEDSTRKGFGLQHSTNLTGIEA